MSLRVATLIGRAHAETADSLSLAMLVLLESLSPEQRAVLLLHDVFDYGYPEVAAFRLRRCAPSRSTAAQERPFFLDGQQRLLGVLALDIVDGQITGINGIVNPEKLTHLGPVADTPSQPRTAPSD